MIRDFLIHSLRLEALQVADKLITIAHTVNNLKVITHDDVSKIFAECLALTIAVADCPPDLAKLTARLKTAHNNVDDYADQMFESHVAQHRDDKNKGKDHRHE